MWSISHSLLIDAAQRAVLPQPAVEACCAHRSLALPRLLSPPRVNPFSTVVSREKPSPEVAPTTLATCVHACRLRQLEYVHCVTSRRAFIAEKNENFILCSRTFTKHLNKLSFCSHVVRAHTQRTDRSNRPLKWPVITTLR